MTIVIDDKIPFIQGVFESAGCKVVYAPGAKFTPAMVKDATALIVRTRTSCNEDLLRGSSVRMVATATIGYDHLDTAWLDAANIAWTNAPGCNASSVVQYIASALARLPFAPVGRVLGIVGVGHVGSKVALLGRALGMEVLLNDPPRRDAEKNFPHCELPELLRRSDVVTVHTPLARTGRYPTFHLADAAFFSMMKPGAFLFNTSRGEVADGEALLAMLCTKRIGAVLDVWENEPEIDLALLQRVRFGTPHIAGYSVDGKAMATQMSVRAVAQKLGIAPLFDFVPTGLPCPEHANLGALPPLEAILATYDLARDAAALSAAPGEFENLRGNYPPRREFSAYSAPGNEALGFRGQP